jgi:hypothetical protein
LAAKLKYTDMRILVSIFLVFICIELFSQTDSLNFNIDNTDLFISLPNNEWHLTDFQNDTAKGITIRFFKRNEVMDSDSIYIIPNIAVITEYVGDSLDVINYSIYKRMQTPFDVDKVLTFDDGELGYNNSVGFKGKYKDDRFEHLLYMTYAINKSYGVQIIMDCTLGVASLIDKEFLKCLKGLREK